MTPYAFDVRINSTWMILERRRV